MTGRGSSFFQPLRQRGKKINQKWIFNHNSFLKICERDDEMKEEELRGLSRFVTTSLMYEGRTGLSLLLFVPTVLSIVVIFLIVSHCCHCRRCSLYRCRCRHCRFRERRTFVLRHARTFIAVTFEAVTRPWLNEVRGEVTQCGRAHLKRSRVRG